LENHPDYWIEKLQLQSHPEGGYFRETYRSEEFIKKSHLPSRYTSARNYSTAIYYLLKGHQFSSLHRLRTDEVWHFYIGSSLTLHIIDQGGNYSKVTLGTDFERGENFQATVSAGCWFGATVDDSNSFSFVGCSLAPGFDFADFELGERRKLLKEFPAHKKIIEMLTK